VSEHDHFEDYATDFTPEAVPYGEGFPLPPHAGVPTEAETSALVGVRIVSLDEFADTPEDGDEALLGDAENAAIPEGGDVLLYGDGGAGKTTLAFDLACHLAAGDDWLGIAVSKPRRVLVIENDGPRARLRTKLRRKRDGWAGSPLDDRIEVLEHPWGAFTFAAEQWREVLAKYVREREIDVVIVGPVAAAGMEAAGTMQEVRAFLALVDDVRSQSGRRLVVLLVHHENKAGTVSGAWEGAGDTLLHLSARGHGRARLHWQKARWASDYHATSLDLAWAGVDGFTIEEKDELDDDTLAEQLKAFIGRNPGTGWTPVEQATPGVAREQRKAVRDRLLSDGEIVNVGKDGMSHEVALDHVPAKRAARLFPAQSGFPSPFSPLTSTDA
jgi:AAA domain